MLDTAVTELAHTLGTGDILLDTKGTAPSNLLNDEQLVGISRGILSYVIEHPQKVLGG